MKELLQPNLSITNREIRRVLIGSLVAPYFSNSGLISFAGSDMNLTDIVLKVNLINQENKSLEYYIGGVAPIYKNSGYNEYFPEEKVILQDVDTWLREKGKFEQLSKKQKNIEKLRSLVGLSGFQPIFKQDDLKKAFESAKIG